ncbi:unnamed protein product [Adineta steineri]|uniref:Arrestin C-terminal-like domain-containing protein n=1 Tax=Adineta steineri TaxID=433720 RepID=A0A819A7J0_9BILA|nr:unnamed protein product [Adineta steineri]CAF3737924.1 unnamed protein product [Adineta steineri]CAF3775664.1 unnamed protein product [Adineta steineri]
MGNTDSNTISGLTINLTNRSTNDPIYFLGEHVECIIQLQDTEQFSDFKLKDAYVELAGEFPCMTSITQGDPSNMAGMVPIIEQVTFFKERRSLLTEVMQVNNKTNCESSVSNKWSFSFSLPVDLPPSFHPTIIYCIRVVLQVKKWRYQTFSHSIPITVYSRLNIPDHLYHPATFDTHQRDVRLQASIAGSIVSPGLQFSIQYDLYNPKRSVIEGIQVKLYQYRTMFKSKPLKTVILQKDVSNVNNFQEEHLHDQIELTLPTEHLPSTLSYNSLNYPLLSAVNPILVTYEFKMLVRVHGILSNLTLRFPVTMNTDVDSSLPPSYASIEKI